MAIVSIQFNIPPYQFNLIYLLINSIYLLTKGDKLNWTEMMALSHDVFISELICQRVKEIRENMENNWILCLLRLECG